MGTRNRICPAFPAAEPVSAVAVTVSTAQPIRPGTTNAAMINLGEIEKQKVIIADVLSGYHKVLATRLSPETREKALIQQRKLMGLHDMLDSLANSSAGSTIVLTDTQTNRALNIYREPF
jgi:hypothetical protein